FALVVGIDNYRSSKVANLRKAVSDAQSVVDLLLEMQVPDTNISVLLNDQATADSIIQQLNRLRDDPRIPPGAPILFYFAGHSAIDSQSMPPTWCTYDDGGHGIRALVPHDGGFRDDASSPDGPLLTFPLLSSVLMDVSQKKGDNITIILDVSHAGPDGPGMDEMITSIPRRCIAGAPYVLLAGCGHGEAAMEGKTGGLFTQALISVLRSGSGDAGNTLTYRDLVRRLPTLAK
ncbi:hypothetical protein K488DRAFT_59460, partial [Vararia minispora EC-137]